MLERYDVLLYIADEEPHTDNGELTMDWIRAYPGETVRLLGREKRLYILPDLAYKVQSLQKDLCLYWMGHTVYFGGNSLDLQDLSRTVNKKFPVSELLSYWGYSFCISSLIIFGRVISHN